jgi:mannose-6-phosphate isomerase-like protein (cupin superfamily)
LLQDQLGLGVGDGRQSRCRVSRRQVRQQRPPVDHWVGGGQQGALVGEVAVGGGPRDLGGGRGLFHGRGGALGEQAAGGGDQGVAGAAGLVEARFPADFGPPLHVHHREDEALYVLDGQLRCRNGDHEFTAGPGQLVFGPRELPHTFKAGPGGARALVLMLPAGLEQMFQEGGVPALDPSTPPVEDYDIETVTRLAAKYGFDVIGPPLS